MTRAEWQAACEHAACVLAGVSLDRVAYTVDEEFTTTVVIEDGTPLEIVHVKNTMLSVMPSWMGVMVKPA